MRGLSCLLVSLLMFCRDQLRHELAPLHFARVWNPRMLWLRIASFLFDRVGASLVMGNISCLLVYFGVSSLQCLGGERPGTKYVFNHTSCYELFWLAAFLVLGASLVFGLPFCLALSLFENLVRYARLETW